MQHRDPTPRLFSPYYGMLVFKNHQELERIELERRSNNGWDKLTHDEIMLMKVFHRGFQMQDSATDVSSCCWGNPTNALEVLNEVGKPIKN